MDYDDNDFQSQNFHLTGEGSSKFSPVLHPYALPRFDFDDSLQGHLRFDSLVENEVFLGIPTQEDNQWIDDFSRGSSGIEFSSSAVKSCSISRRKNVWSEATSSESVEMLLKSVSQEDMAQGETIVEESDAGNEVGTPTEQTEPNPRQDDIMENVKDSLSMLPPDEFQGSLSELSVNAGGEYPHPKHTLRGQDAELCASTSSSELERNVVSEKCDLFVSEDNMGSEQQCDGVHQQDVDNAVLQSLNIKKQEGFSLCGTPVDTVDSCSQDFINGLVSSSQNVISGLGGLNDLELRQQVNGSLLENASGITKDICKGVEECDIQTVEANKDDQILSGHTAETCASNLGGPFCVDFEVKTSEELAVETSITEVERHSMLPLEGDSSDLQIEGCNEDVCSTKPAQDRECGVVVSPRGTEMKQQPKCDVLHKGPSVATQCNVSFEGDATDVNSVQIAICASSEPKMDSLVQILHGKRDDTEEQEKTFESDIQIEIKDSVGNFESSFLSAEDSKLPILDDKSSINLVDNFVNVTGASSSAGSCREQQAIDNSNCGDDKSCVSPTMLVESIQICKENLCSGQVAVHDRDQDGPSPKSSNPELLTDPMTMEVEVVGSLDSDKRVESLSLGEVIEEDAEVTNVSESGTNFGNVPAIDFDGESTTLASRVTLIGAPVLSGNGANTNESVSHNGDGNSPLLIEGSFHVDKKEDMEVKNKEGMSLLSHKESSPMPVESAPISEVDKGTSFDCSEIPCKTVDQSTQIMDVGDTAAESERVAVVNEASQKCSENLEAIPIHCDFTIKQGDITEAVVENHKGTTAEKNLEPASLKATVDPAIDHQASCDITCSSDDTCLIGCGGTSAEYTKVHCDSATVISCTKISQNGEDKQCGGKGPAVEIVSVPKVINGIDGKVQSDSAENDTSKEEKSFTFDVSMAGLSEGETGKSWQSLPIIQACKMSTIVRGSPLASSSCKMNSKMVQEMSSGTSQAVAGLAAVRGTQITPVRKTRRASAKLAKENAKKGNHAKDATPVKLSEKGDKSFVPMNNSVHEDLKPYGNVENSGTKPTGVISLPTLNLPDLNTLASSSALYQQPFTDLQQVQLRAQIFVYGSLIQGVVPDEACMVSAFGPSDGGNIAWEPAWRACVVRLCGHRSVSNTPETPVHSHSEMRNVGFKASDQALKQVSVQSKGPPMTVSRASSKSASSPVVNPMIPLSSPLWNISTSCDSLQSSGLPRGPLVDYHQVLSPLHPYQSPPVRNFLGHTTSGLSQAAIPGPRYTSLQTSAFDVNARFSPLPTIETVKLTPLKESPVPVSSSSKHVTPVHVAHSGGSSVFVGTSSLADANKVTVTLGHHSADSKARKRKKVSVPEDLCQISVPVQTHTTHVSTPIISSILSKLVTVSEGIGQISLLTSSQSGLVSVPVVSSHFSTSVAVTTTVTSPARVSKGNSGNFLTAVSFTPSDQPKRDQVADKKTLISEDTFSKVEDAKLQAEVAAGHAASAVGHCQGVWCQLDKQKDSGSISDFEAKLASAAVAIAAAASVAKAAAAAANVASNVAVQARLMADEALALYGSGSFAQSNPGSVHDVVNYLGKATPASILKGGEGSSNYSSSIIIAAREAARRRVEAASTASKHAENLDAIVKAAELAAEAVSQAGKIVAMGDPLRLTGLAHAGPDGYWKGPRVLCELGVTSNNLNGDQSNLNSLGEIPSVSGRSKRRLSDKKMRTTDCGVSPVLREGSRDMSEDHLRVVEDDPNSAACGEKELRGQNGRGASDLTKTIGVVPESEIGSRSNSVISRDGNEHGAVTSKENSIKEGCLVEVFKDNGDYKGAWFSANISSLRDGKAFVTYTDLQSEEGQLKEWVPLEGEGNKAPKIRLAHPMTSTLFEGTRKRRRAAMRDSAWSVGDRVDVWSKNCWREGVVTEKKDETTVNVYLPAHEEISVVRTWHLRSTLVWKDGEWIESSASRENCSSQGDTPREKRLKPGSPIIAGKGKGKISKNVDLMESGECDESSLLPLSANEKVFNIGKNIRDENKPEALRTTRTGLWKEGSRVVFGIPKPGKKRKFMEVSKHYVYDGTDVNNDGNNSVKFPKKLMPQGRGSRGWKANSKIDSKDRQDIGSKSKVVKTGKVQSATCRTSPEKDNFLASAVSAPNDATMTNNARCTASNDENESGQQNLMGYGGFSKTGEAAEGQVVYSSLACPPEAPKTVTTSNAKYERQNKGKLVSVGGKSSKGEVKDKLIPEVVEPRRSNRRIQPTSRLLEGLQSSLIISKIPSVSHDKSYKSQNRGSSKGNNNHG